MIIPNLWSSNCSQISTPLIRSVSLRYFNAAGADPEGEIGEACNPEPHLIPIVLAAARDGKSVIRRAESIDGITAMTLANATPARHASSWQRLLPATAFTTLQSDA
jgi:hypothetical protein